MLQVGVAWKRQQSCVPGVDGHSPHCQIVPAMTISSQDHIVPLLKTELSQVQKMP